MTKMENSEYGNNFTISYDNLFKCPICKGKLETYSLMGLIEKEGVLLKKNK